MRMIVVPRGIMKGMDPPDEQYGIISISTWESDAVRMTLPEGSVLHRGSLRLFFADIDRPCEQNEKVIFSQRDAKAIWSFVEGLRASGVGLLLLHCDAGNSRSPAVAAAISKVYDGDDSHWFHRYNPNRYVFRTLFDTWYDMHPQE